MTRPEPARHPIPIGPAISVALLATGLLAGGSLIGACGSSTGPGDKPATLSLSAPPIRPVTSAYTDAAGQRSLGCTADVAAAAAEQDIVLDSAKISYLPTAGGATRVVHLAGQDVATLWGTTSVPAGSTRRATVTFRHSAAFTARLTVAYHAPRGGAGSATAAVQCVAPILGTYVLSTINDVRLPAASGYETISSDTLTFAADLTYTTRGRWGESAVYGLATPPGPYTVSGPDSLTLPEFLPGYGGGLVTRKGTTLSYTRPGYTFRWDSAGSAPVLPPAPAFVLSKSAVAFTVTQGASAPAPDTVFVRSSTDQAFTSISWTGSSACEQGICGTDWLLTSQPGALTPTLVTFRVLRTNIPLGTYTALLFLTSPSVGTNAGVVTVTLTITKP